MIDLFFITLIKWKQTPTKEIIDRGTKMLEDLEKQGIKARPYWTLGHYDAVAFVEAPTEKDAMKILIGFSGFVDTETMVAIPRDEAIKLL